MINNVVTNPASSEESTYQIDGMTCQGCVKRVHAALVPFAETVTVNLNPPHTVLIRPKGDLVVLQNALAGTRYLIKILDKQAERLGDDLLSKQGKSKVAVSTTLPIMPNDQSWLSTDKHFNRLKASIAPWIGHHPCAKTFVILTTA